MIFNPEKILDNMKESLLFLAEGFEEIEAVTVIDVLRRADIPLKTVSITPCLQVKGAHGITIEADAFFGTLETDDFDYLILPGGMPGTKHLDENKRLNEWLVAHAQNGGRMAAICAAPSVLGRLGVLRGKKATCYPGFESALQGADFTAATVEADGNVITANGPAAALRFALSLVASIKGENEAQQVEAAM